MRKLLAVMALAALVGCKGDSSTNPNSVAIDGAYSLKSVNNSPLPFVVQSGTNTFTLTSDNLTVGTNGSWSENGAYRQTVNGQSSTGTFSDGGTWIRAGSSVTLNSSNTGTASYSGTIISNGLSLSDGTFAYIFAK